VTLAKTGSQTEISHLGEGDQPGGLTNWYKVRSGGGGYSLFNNVGRSGFERSPGKTGR